MTHNRERAATIAALNDALRQDPFSGQHGRVVHTSGVASEGVEFITKALTKLASLTPQDFERGNDPYHERDFAVFDVDGVPLYAKTDYFEKSTNLTAGAETPENPETTDRVMTIMLREEY